MWNCELNSSFSNYLSFARKQTLTLEHCQLSNEVLETVGLVYIV